jgi:hypothetical protein
MIRSVVRTLAGLILVASVLGWPMRPAQPAHAATVVVSVCDKAHLQAAIDAAPEGGTVTFNGDCTLTATRSVHVAKPLTIDGGLHKVTIKGAISGDRTSPVLQIDARTQGTAGVTLRNLTFAVAGNSLVTNAGTLTVVNTTFRGGKAIYGPCPSTFPRDYCPPNYPHAANSGGGIFNTNHGTLTVIHSTFSQNQAYLGGGIYSLNGSVTVIDSTFSSNAAALYGDGGGIYVQSGQLTVIDSTFSGNNAGFNAGGIFNAGTAMISGSTIVGSRAGANTKIYTGSGGGVLNGGSGVLTVVNSTFSGNAAYIEGGGIDNEGQATVANSTFSGNIARSGGSLFDSYREGRNEALLPGTFTLRNTILASPRGFRSCNRVPHDYIDEGGNVDDDGTCNFPPSRSNVSLDLGPLGNYGGRTPTFFHIVAQPPLPGRLCTGGSLDQRGYYLPFPVCLPGATQPNAIQPTGTISLADVSSQIGRTIVISATVSGAVFYTGPNQKPVSVPYPSSLVRPTGTITFWAPLNEGKPIPCAEGDPVTHAVPLPDTTSPQTVTCIYSGLPLYGNQIVEPVWAQYSGDSLFRGYTTPVTPITIQVASPD